MRNLIRHTITNFIFTGTKEPHLTYTQARGFVAIRNESLKNYHWQVFVPDSYGAYLCEYQIFSTATGNVIERGVIYIS